MSLSSRRLESRALCALAALMISLLLGLGSGCERSSKPTAAAQDRLDVFVSILPLAFVAEQLGGPRVNVQVLVAPGQSPETYAPTPRQLASLASADLLVRIGVPFEDALLPRLAASDPAPAIVQAQDGIELRQIAEEVGHGHGAPDPHVWLDPQRTATMARNIAGALSTADPAGAKSYQANLEGLLRKLDSLDRELAGSLAPSRGRRLFAYHGAYQYFCERYGLEQVPLSHGEQQPGARHVAEFIEQAKKQRATTLFVQPQFSRRQAEAIAQQMGAQVVALDPLAKDYPANMRRIAQAVRAAVAPRPEPAESN